MPRINLLPWREQERKVRRREFMVAAGGAVIAAVIFTLGGKLLYASWTEAQNEKNALLKKEIVKLDAQIANLETWIAQGFWFCDTWIADWTRHPNFPRPPEDAYRDAINLVHDLSYFMFFGYSPYKDDTLRKKAKA
jgi:hypothetical protein